jgi:hypothetical protein
LDIEGGQIERNAKFVWKQMFGHFRRHETVAAYLLKSSS